MADAAPRSGTGRFGPLEPLIADRTISEIMVNGPQAIFVERKGRIERTDAAFADDRELRRLMEAIAVSAGRELSAAHPCMDARLPDGSRVNCVVPPVAVDGPSMTIRKFPESRFSMEELLTRGALDLKMARFLLACVRARVNIVVSGGTGSGKTTLLNVLSDAIPQGERVVSIEDTAELRLAPKNLVRLEAVAPIPGEQGVPIRDLVINALRMRPDRIIVGECRGAEAFDMLTAMNTGHEGSITTIHANGGRDCLGRLETMSLMAGTEMPLSVVREKIAGAVELVVHVQRCLDGVRRIVEVHEIAGVQGDVISSQEIFEWSERGGFTCRGLAPGFVKGFEGRGVSLPAHYFSDEYVPPPLGSHR